jgi:hypothetical protein
LAFAFPPQLRLGPGCWWIAGDLLVDEYFFGDCEGEEEGASGLEAVVLVEGYGLVVLGIDD